MSAGLGLWPSDVAAIYGIPPQWDGQGASIGVVALGGGFDPDDVALACGAMGRTVPDVLPVFPTIDGQTSGYNGGATQGDMETALDLQVLAGIVPRAQIVVYCVPNSPKGLSTAISEALTDTQHRPSVLSISWAYPECPAFLSFSDCQCIEDALKSADNAGVTIVAAAGDGFATAKISDGKTHVCYPGSSQYVVSCGGTQIQLTGDGKSIADESVWNDHHQQGTDGGRSSYITPAPDYQSTAPLPPPSGTVGSGRGVPDVAAVAGFQPGYRIFVAGKQITMGGTSAATPLWAALIAIANTKRQRSLTGAQIHRFLYSNPNISTLLKPITEGNNYPPYGPGFDAGPGWNACTGWGAPMGSLTINALAQIDNGN